MPATTSPAAPAPPARAQPLRYERLRLRHRDNRPFTAHVVRVDLCHPGVTLRATAPDESPALTSAWARRTHAIAALNGDFFDTPARPGPIRPLGPARGAGRDFPPRALYYFGAIVAMRADAPPAIHEGFPTDPRDTDVLATQERVVIAGQLHLDPQVNHSVGRHPRSAIGLTRDRRTLILVAVDGRSRRSSGVTTPELGALMRELGAWEAARMDGGGSSTLVLADRGVVNTPSDGHERAVANHLGVLFDPSATAVPSFCTAPAP